MGREFHERRSLVPRLLTCFFLLNVMLVTRALPFENSTRIGVVNSYVDRCRADCSIYKDVMTCGKYKAARWLHDFVRQKEFSYGALKIIRIPSLEYDSILPRMPRSRAFKTGIVDALNFVRDSVEDLLTKRAIIYTVDTPVSARKYSMRPMIIDEDELDDLETKQDPQGDWRIFKKKKSLILPILILLNLFKLKLLLLPIFLGVHFIKKLLVLGGLIVPSILAHLKVCKVPHSQQTYPYHSWATAAEAPVDYPTGYAQEETNWIHRNDIQNHIALPSYHAFRHPYG